MPCGVGGLPTGAGLVDRAVNQGPWLQERVVRAGWQFQKKREGWLQTLERRPLGPPLGPRLGLGGGPRASVPGR